MNWWRDWKIRENSFLKLDFKPGVPWYKKIYHYCMLYFKFSLAWLLVLWCMLMVIGIMIGLIVGFMSPVILLWYIVP